MTTAIEQAQAPSKEPTDVPAACPTYDRLITVKGQSKAQPRRCGSEGPPDM
jgi:hypothetical protein